MKKILIATTALVATAGVAAADVSVSGSARMGLIYVDTGVTGEDSTVRFTSRFRVKFDASGETDGGLAFGASVRADNAVAGVGNTAMSAGKVWISGGFGKLSMGDVDSAGNAAVGHVSGVGLTGLGDVNETGGYIGQIDTSVLYEYSTGSFTIYVGLGQIDSVGTLAGAAFTDGSQYSIGAKYSAGNYTVALGYETASGDVAGTDTDIDLLALGGSATFGDATVKAVFKTLGGDADGDAAALSLDYVFGAATVTAFVSQDFAEEDGFGLGASYDLGGGAKVKGGVASYGDAIAADFGLAFEF